MGVAGKHQRHSQPRGPVDQHRVVRQQDDRLASTGAGQRGRQVGPAPAQVLDTGQPEAAAVALDRHAGVAEQADPGARERFRDDATVDPVVVIAEYRVGPKPGLQPPERLGRGRGARRVARHVVAEQCHDVRVQAVGRSDDPRQVGRAEVRPRVKVGDQRDPQSVQAGR